MERDTSAGHRTGEQMSTKLKPVTYPIKGGKVFLKSRVREICKHGSVRGYMVSSIGGHVLYSTFGQCGWLKG